MIKVGQVVSTVSVRHAEATEKRCQSRAGASQWLKAKTYQWNRRKYKRLEVRGRVQAPLQLFSGMHVDSAPADVRRLVLVQPKQAVCSLRKHAGAKGSKTEAWR
eukprot:15303189-Alexandrium_andersonii.AAC.1